MEGVFSKLLALSCGFFWACSVVLFKSIQPEIPPKYLNFFKNTLAFSLFLLIFIALQKELVFDLSSIATWKIFLIGLVGIALADYLFLKSLEWIGAAMLAIVDCLYSPTLIFLGVFYFQESLTWIQCIAVLIIFSAVVISSIDTYLQKKSMDVKVSGYFIGACAVVLMALSIGFIKDEISQFDFVQLILIRTFGGFLGSLLMMRTKRDWSNYSALFKHPQVTRLMLASYLAGFLGMYLWVLGFRFEAMSITAILNQTATVFTVLMAVFFLKERVSFVQVCTISLALVGVIILIMNPGS